MRAPKLKSELAEPARGTRWILKAPPPLPSDSPQRIVRVMAVADNYVMARYPGAIPFLKSVKEFRNEYEPVT